MKQTNIKKLLTQDVYTTKYTKGTNKRKFIMLHHTADKNVSFNSMVDFLSKGPKQVSVHYVVGRRGEIARIGLDTYILWHAGLGFLQGYKNNINKAAIGIEIQNDGYEEFPQEQKDAVKKLVLFLSNKYRIKEKQIIRHKDYAPIRKIDVSDKLWNTDFDTFESYKSAILNNEPKKEEEKTIVEKKVVKYINEIIINLQGLKKLLE